MERGLYIAASGMVSEMARQDLIANDLANASTPGYKADRAVQGSFGDLLLSNTATGATVGPLGLGSRIERQVTDLTAAPVKETGEPLDFAAEGDGFFAVQTAQGMRYTRNGQFTATAQGTLADQRGNAVLGQNGQPVRVGANGTVDPTAVGLFNVANARKVGDALFQGQKVITTIDSTLGKAANQVGSL
jgi:flagellar basal-body rod protein FlgF